MKTIGDNDLILIIYKGRKYLKRITQGGSFHGKGGMLAYDALIGQPYGWRWGEYDIFEPTIEDIIMYGISRETQVIYPKDSYFICFRLDVKAGSRILETGTGSAGLTILLSRLAGPTGSIVTFEKEERHFRNAKRNIEKFADFPNVDFRNEDIMEAEVEGGFDAAFIDVREPWLCLDRVRGLLKESGPVGMIVPTANQLSEILKGLERGWGEVEVLEIFLRKYKTVAERVRPVDRMVAHTGYLAFARKLNPLEAVTSLEEIEEE